MPQTAAANSKTPAMVADVVPARPAPQRAGTNPLQPDTRTPIKLELDADEMRRDASYRLSMAKHGYCNPDHPGDLELKARWEREARELIASAERNEQRAREIRAASVVRRQSAVIDLCANIALRAAGRGK